MENNEILNRIRDMMTYRHWSIYRLAKESGLPYSSLNNVFVRQTCPSVPILEKVCHGFGISLCQFFEYKENPLRDNRLTEEEDKLINTYRSLSGKNKELVEVYIQGLCKK